MFDPQSGSEHQQHHAQKLPLLLTQRLSWKKPIENSLRAATLPKKKLSAEVSCELGLGFQSLEEFEVHGNPRRVCRICHRQFPSGRALGGHMRVHGPLFTPAAGRKRKLVLADSDSEEEEDEESVVDVATSLSGEGYTPHIDSSRHVYDGDDADADENDDLGADYYMAAHDKDHGSIYGLEFANNPERDDDDASTEKNPLYKLRHKPKKSRKFTNEDFSMEILAFGQDMAIKTPTKGSIFPSTESARVCSVCGKAFWSWKALSGHMRCHPEREWRGVLPPGEKSGSRFNHKKSSALSNHGESSNFEHESDVEDKADADPGTAGIKNTALHAEDEEASEEQLQSNDDEKDCVSSSSAMEYESNPLWPTGKRSRRKSTEIKARSVLSSPQRDHDERLITSQTNSLADLGEAEQVVEIPDLLFMLAEAAWTIEQETLVQKNHLQKGRPMIHFSSTKENARGKQESQAFLFDLTNVTNTAKGTMKFECSTCKKTFNSPQALGGHRASHKKTKGCFARTSLGEETTPEELGIASEDLALSTLLRGDVPDQDFVKKPKSYECSVCHRMFLTGQALGGHKSRCHYTGEKVAEAAASVTSSSKQASERGNSSKVDEGSILDLNLPASSINEDSEVGCAAVELDLFRGDGEAEVAEKDVAWTTESHHPAELSLGAPWAVKHLSQSTSWALEGGWPAVEPAMVF